MRSSHLQQVLSWLAAVVATVFGGLLHAQSPDSVEFFENRIRPVLVERCYECHSSEADEIGGSLVLDSRDGMMSGGDSGPAIDPGNVDGSMLISAIRYESSEMPPDGKLSEEVVHDFEQWIAAGAVDPRRGNATQPMISGIDLEAGRSFWAFRPPTSSVPAALPVFDRDSKSDRSGVIDSFLDQRLAEARVEPNGLALPSVQLRRLAFDLTGLPPTPEVQDRWRSDPSPRNWGRLVDELLASPQFGEHWARHLSLIHISEPTRQLMSSRMPSSA